MTIYKEFSASTQACLGRYVRSVLTKGPVTMYYRNKSVDELLAGMNEIKNILLDEETFLEGVLEVLQATKSTAEVVRLETSINHTLETLRIKMEEIRLQMIKIYHHARTR